MNRFRLRRTAVTFGAAALVLVSVCLLLKAGRSRISPSRRADRAAIHRVPRTVLWAWERPTDLGFIDPDQVGVAFLACTVRLRGDQMIVRPRLQPLNLPSQTPVVAVARIETDSSEKPAMSQEQSERVAGKLTELSSFPSVSAIQIDFDATKSEREFYRNVIVELRRRLPADIALSITALASWCGDDDWISDLPIDEAVPMLFRMGADRNLIRNRLSAGQDFTARPCMGSYGVSVDEPLANLARDKRLYVFNPQPWTEASMRAILELRK